MVEHFRPDVAVVAEVLHQASKLPNVHWMEDCRETLAEIAVYVAPRFRSVQSLPRGRCINAFTDTAYPDDARVQSFSVL